MTLPVICVRPLSAAATGPLITRVRDRAVPSAVTMTLGSPGCSGFPSGSSPCPGTSVQSLTSTVAGAPVTSSRPASQMPESSSCPGGGAAPDAETAPGWLASSRSPNRTGRPLAQAASWLPGPPGGSGWPATTARLAPGGSWMAAVPVTSTVSEADPGTTITPAAAATLAAYSFHRATASSSAGSSAEPTTAVKPGLAGSAPVRAVVRS